MFRAGAAFFSYFVLAVRARHNFRVTHPMNSDVPEKTRLNFGFIPLADCAPLVVAKERGYFERYGLEVSLHRQASWANIRDKLAVGALDGAHMLAAMPIAMSLGLDALHVPMVAPLALNLNGNAVTVSERLYQEMLAADAASMSTPPLSARALKLVVEARRRQGKPPLTFAMVFPFSTHNYLLRYWLASAGIDPDRDIRLIVVPPPQMVSRLQTGNVDGYCVGEPWNELAVTEGMGRVVITSYEIWNNHPEKVFGVKRDWAELYPNTLKAVLMALLEAARWMDDAEHRDEVAALIAREDYVGVAESVLRLSMSGGFVYAPETAAKPLPDFDVFHRYAATFPWLSHAEWLMTQMMRWGQLAECSDIHSAAAAVYRPDLYRQAASGLGLPCPAVERKQEGGHAGHWLLEAGDSTLVMGADLFFDGMRFDPADPLGYLGGFSPRGQTAGVGRLAAGNG